MWRTWKIWCISKKNKLEKMNLFGYDLEKELGEEKY